MSAVSSVDLLKEKIQSFTTEINRIKHPEKYAEEAKFKVRKLKKKKKSKSASNLKKKIETS